MNSADVLEDGFDRVRESVHAVLDGLSYAELCERVDGTANSIAWLVWHLSRVQDDHIAEVAGTEQVWTSGGWHERAGLPFEVGDIGFGHTSDQVGVVRCDGATLIGYHDAVHDTTAGFVRGLSDGDLDRIVDERWDPPVTLGVRLISVLDDDLEHAGQAAFVRGILERR